jgi:hypothetical protein
MEGPALTLEGNMEGSNRGAPSRRLARLAAGALVLGLAACGGSDGGPGHCPDGQTGVPPNCVAIMDPCSQTTVVQDSGSVPSLSVVYDDFSVPETGRLDVTMDWTDPASPVGFYLVPANTCTLDEFNARSCNFVVRSESFSKPRKISTANFAAGNYRWMVANFADADESVALQIVLSKGSGCPALATGGPAVSARAAADLPPVTRAIHR